MKKVLIVTPNWPPVNCPDMQRIRMAISYFEEFSWKPMILKVDPNEQDTVKDFNLLDTIPENTLTWQAGFISKRLAKYIALKSIGLRSFFHLARLGEKIIKMEKPDLIFFSTTMFPLMIIGRYWFWKYKLPYILDFQDPWLSDYYEENKDQIPPGGRLKYNLTRIVSSYLEPLALSKASHIISVSPKYVDTLLQRYKWLSDSQFTVLPFGAPQKDFDVLSSLNIQQNVFDPNDGYRHWVYVGRGGDDMAFSLNRLFAAIQKHRQNLPEAWQKIKIHFVGTKYSIFDNSKPIEAIANSYNLIDMVTEYPQRIPYFEALKVLTDSHGIMIIGSDDQGYSASKVYPCILARKPILAILHQNSLVVNVIESCNAGQVVTFLNPITENIVETLIPKLLWLLSQSQFPEVTTDWEAFEPYTAKSMTQQLCAIFDNYVSF